MAQIYVSFPHVSGKITELESIARKIGKTTDKFSQIMKNIDWDIQQEENIYLRSQKISQDLNNYQVTLISYKEFLSDSYDKYQKLDKYGQKSSYLDTASSHLIDSALNIIPGVPHPGEVFRLFFGENGLFPTALLFGFNSTEAGKLVKIFSNLLNGKNALQTFKNLDDLREFLSNAAKTFNNYRKIGRAIGTKKAMANWAKHLFGLNKVRGLSKAKNIGTAFKNNLTNKTSPFNMKNALGDTAKNFAGKNGFKSAVGAWAGAALNLGFNYMDNKDEQAASGGSMSDERVVAETVTETVVSTAATAAGTAAAGAAVGAIATTIGVACPPALVVSAATGFVLSGANQLVKHITGKTAVEWASDTIIDGIGHIGNAIKAKFTASTSIFSFAFNH